MLNFHEISNATKYQLRKLGISIQDVRQAADYEGVRHEWMAQQFISQAIEARD